ncbi:MAG: enoyl-CoA hydratase-related protein [Alphaproteobacteria bacterium]
MSDILRLDIQDAVLTITLDRPKANAINAEMSHAMAAAFTRFKEDDSLQVAIITGQGEKFFSGGWDMNEVAAGVSDVDSHGAGGFAGLRVLLDCNKPVIAAVNGYAIGGGWEIVLAADLVIATENVRFWFPEVRRGIVPDAGGSQRLPYLLPRRIALEVLLTSRWFELEEAVKYGHVNAVVTHAELLPRARAMAAAIAEGAPLAIRATKEVIRAAETLSDRDAFLKLATLDLPAYKKALASPDYFEGARAYTEDRKAEFRGR